MWPIWKSYLFINSVWKILFFICLNLFYKFQNLIFNFGGDFFVLPLHNIFKNPLRGTNSASNLFLCLFLFQFVRQNASFRFCNFHFLLHTPRCINAIILFFLIPIIFQPPPRFLVSHPPIFAHFWNCPCSHPQFSRAFDPLTVCMITIAPFVFLFSFLGFHFSSFFFWWLCMLRRFQKSIWDIDCVFSMLFRVLCFLFCHKCPGFSLFFFVFCNCHLKLVSIYYFSGFVFQYWSWSHWRNWVPTEHRKETPFGQWKFERLRFFVLCFFIAEGVVGARRYCLLLECMGQHEGWGQPTGLLPNGLLPNEGSSAIRVLDPERWLKAEERTAELIVCVQPNRPSEELRNAVADYVQRLVVQCFPCQVRLLICSISRPILFLFLLLWSLSFSSVKLVLVMILS